MATETIFPQEKRSSDCLIRLSRLEERVQELETEITRLKKLVDPAYGE